jgi:hypothetical protein
VQNRRKIVADLMAQPQFPARARKDRKWEEKAFCINFHEDEIKRHLDEVETTETDKVLSKGEQRKCKIRSAGEIQRRPATKNWRKAPPYLCGLGPTMAGG